MLTNADYTPATRPEQAQNYPGFAAHPPYASNYVNAQSQVPSGLPHSATTSFNPITPSQQYGPHDPTYYPGQNVPYPGYVDTLPRQLPEIISYIPNGGQQGTKVTVYFRSIYDFDLPPQVTPVIMFGPTRCESWLVKTAKGQSQGFEYALSADAPALSPSSPPSPQIPLSLTFDNSSVAWQSPSVQIGSFTYLSPPPSLYPTESPQQTAPPKKRKLSLQASPRRSPNKKPSLQQLSGHTSACSTATPVSPFRKPSIPDFSQSRRFSGPEYQQHFGPSLHRAQSQQFYGSAHVTPSQPIPQSQAWNYLQSTTSSVQSPSIPSLSAGGKASLLPSPAAVSNPPLIRTSTLQQSPTTTGPPPVVTQTFNPYTMYPANTKAVLELEGNLSTMATKWTAAEWEAKRRLVQFRRSQQGSVIKGTFEPVTLEDRIPNSICVSCIWWQEKDECYVTSVDTIQLLESLVAVRFTVEEKNRIRRNLEGFRPATVSKTKADSEEFFKIIMGFPNPKPRNIEKDVKVFPWRILAGALKKIIGKYVSRVYACMLSSTNHASSPRATHRQPVLCILHPLQVQATDEALMLHSNSGRRRLHILHRALQLQHPMVMHTQLI